MILKILRLICLPIPLALYSLLQQQRARLEQQLQMMEQFARNLREYIQRAEASEKFPIDEYLRDLRAVSTENSEEEQDEDNSDSINQFQRESRKPMRLRWGRSTGKAPADQKVSWPTHTHIHIFLG